MEGRFGFCEISLHDAKGIDIQILEFEGRIHVRFGLNGVIRQGNYEFSGDFTPDGAFNKNGWNFRRADFVNDFGV